MYINSLQLLITLKRITLNKPVNNMIIIAKISFKLIGV